jgi:hypothetical protein
VPGGKREDAGYLSTNRWTSLIPSTTPEYWKANLSPVRLQHTGNKKGYETDSHPENGMLNQSLRISEEMDGFPGSHSLHSPILLIENKWFLGISGFGC